VSNEENGKDNISEVDNKTVEDVGSSIQFLTFTVDKNEYGVNIMRVMEIRGWSDTTDLPNTPEFMRGVINLRGQVIPIFDLRSRFGHGFTNANEKNVVIVMAVGERTIGILVDAVSDILTTTADEIREAPSSSETGIDDNYLNGLISVDKKLVILLDIDYLFDDQSLDSAALAAASA